MLAAIQLHPEIAASHLLIMLSEVMFGTALAFTYPIRVGRCALAILLTYLPSTALVQAIPLAERFRASLAAQPRQVEAQELPLTCSLASATSCHSAMTRRKLSTNGSTTPSIG
ncbi:hypothetical protein [Pseudomonas sp. CC6-YY-74]|uniref:hypothetical protein n=1 Tax=Pseudomonas sp. CC6-YY-74 TaxID=1930532 RepID=UPI0009A20D81|nr:hypothetical protein [Pseudomonas sp. CC6-YY-74]